MGLFKSMKNAKGMVADAKQMQADANAMMAEANQPVDPNDPAFEPIEGISLDEYARITAALAKQNLAGIEQVNAWVETQGVQPGTWQTVQNGWVQRMSGNAQVRNRYGVLYSQS
ncbi:MAG: hypothetical protein AAGK32_15910 [Actinomycetota bacterium]